MLVARGLFFLTKWGGRRFDEGFGGDDKTTMTTMTEDAATT
jgi:hypothetical protein